MKTELRKNSKAELAGHKSHSAQNNQSIYPSTNSQQFNYNTLSMSDLYSLVGQVLKDQAALDFKKENDKLREDNDKLKKEMAELKRKNCELEHMVMPHGVLGNQAVDLSLAIEATMSAINSLEAQNSLIPKTAVVLIYCLIVVQYFFCGVVGLLQISINIFLGGCACLGMISIMILEFFV